MVMVGKQTVIEYEDPRASLFIRCKPSNGGTQFGTACCETAVNTREGFGTVQSDT